MKSAKMVLLKHLHVNVLMGVRTNKKYSNRTSTTLGIVQYPSMAEVLFGRLHYTGLLPCTLFKTQMDTQQSITKMATQRTTRLKILNGVHTHRIYNILLTYLDASLGTKGSEKKDQHLPVNGAENHSFKQDSHKYFVRANAPPDAMEISRSGRMGRSQKSDSTLIYLIKNNLIDVKALNTK